ncbi:hypothetical protein DB347_09090 [Opitutaceae bacterium EW11]|nr:hypothetical protein DB347_09090 [Opitutaceae bacterium EW11]
MTTKRVHHLLRAAAIALLLGSLGAWAATGAHLGWTQTSVVETQRDEVTGIDFPVRRPAFIAGVEVPILGLASAAALAGLSLLRRRSSHLPA